MRIDTSKRKIEELLTRGVAEVIDERDLREKLLSGKQLRVKLGIDPTSPDLHLGRAVAILKLKDFQDLGHQIVFLVGNATGVIGDTSDKESERPMLTEKQVQENMRAYTEQAGKILDMEKVEVVYNADWLNDLGYKEIGEHASAFSLHEFIVRDNIKRRLDAGKRVSLREVLYPLMQGYDSVAIKADVELGGTDQRFNLLAGRVLQEQAGMTPQNIVMGNLIDGTDGRKMSSSWGNVITLSEGAVSIGEKVMNMPDVSVPVYFEHCTRISQAEMENILDKDDVREQKIALAGAITAMIHDGSAAEELMNYLRAKFIDKSADTHAQESFQTSNGTPLLDVMVGAGAASSKGDARRKVEQGGVGLGDKKISDAKYTLTSADNEKVLKVGKKFFIKLFVQ